MSTRKRGFGFERLIVWQKACAAAVIADGLAKRFRTRRPDQCRQLVRSSLSVPFNIAEGSSKQTPKARINSFDVARGSAEETATNLLVLASLEPTGRAEAEEAVALYDEVVAMLTSMIRKQKARD